MPNSQQAIKRLRQDGVRNLRNRMVKSELKTLTKKVLTAVEEKNVEAAKSLLKTTQAKLDKALKKGVLHKNTVSRRQSALASRVASIG